MKKYKGTIVQESLTDDRILNDFIFLDFRVTKDKNPNDRWHLFTVQASEKLVIKLAKYLKSEKWYAHFWKTFRFKYNDKSTWHKAVEYGKSIGIPEKQLDFLIDEK